MRQFHVTPQILHMVFTIRVLLYLLLGVLGGPLNGILFQVQVVLEVIYFLSYLEVRRSGFGKVTCYINMVFGSLTLELLLWVMTSLITVILINMCIIVYLLLICWKLPPQENHEEPALSGEPASSGGAALPVELLDMV